MNTEVFQSELLPGESLLWTGQPGRHIFWRPGDWFLVPFFGLWTAAVIWTVRNDLLGRGSQEVDPVVWVLSAALLLIGFYFLGVRFLIEGWLRRHIVYGVTTRRALILYDYGAPKIVSIPLDTLPVVEKSLSRSGRGSLGFAVWFRRGRRGSTVRVYPSFGKDSVPAFLDIDDVERVYQLILHQRGRAARHS